MSLDVFSVTKEKSHIIFYGLKITRSIFSLANRQYVCTFIFLPTMLPLYKGLCNNPFNNAFFKIIAIVVVARKSGFYGSMLSVYGPWQITVP